MTYFSLISAILVVGACFLGRWIGQRGRDVELTHLAAERDKLARMLDFTQAECEHVMALLKGRASTPKSGTVNPMHDPTAMQAKLNHSLQWCEGHRQYDLCADNAGAPYATGEIELMRTNQERYTAAIRKRLDDASGE